MFLGHETMHGAVLRGRSAWAKSLVGMLCFAPLVVSPPRIGGAARFASPPTSALGGGRLRGLLSLVIGFSVQSAKVLITARTRLQISARDHRRALVETALIAGVASVTGAIPFLLVYVLPVVVANVVVMSFIVTNHALSDRDQRSVARRAIGHDAALGRVAHARVRLSRRAPPLPGCQRRHAREIRAALLEAWPERYQSMSLGEPLAQLFRTGRVYQNSITLVDPRSGGAWPALAPNVGSGTDRTARPTGSQASALQAIRSCGTAAMTFEETEDETFS